MCEAYNNDLIILKSLETDLSLVHTVPCTPLCVPAVCSWRTGANRDRIRVRSYIPGSATDQTQFGAKIDHCMSVLVMLWFATVHSRCSFGGATVCPGASRYTMVLPRESAAKPRCLYGGSRKKDGKAPVFYGSIPISMNFS